MIRLLIITQTAAFTSICNLETHMISLADSDVRTPQMATVTVTGTEEQAEQHQHLR